MLDASAALELPMNTSRAKVVVAHVSADGQTLHAPHLIDVEVMHVLRRFVRCAEVVF